MEAKLRVEVKKAPFIERNFYGKSSMTNVVESIFNFEYDKREVIAPHGVKVELTLSDGEIMTIIADKRFLNDNDIYDNMQCFETSFLYQDMGYGLELDFINDELCDVIVREWLFMGDYEDGADEDNLYSLKNGDIKLLEKIY